MNKIVLLIGLGFIVFAIGYFVWIILEIGKLIEEAEGWDVFLTIFAIPAFAGLFFYFSLIPFIIGTILLFVAWLIPSSSEKGIDANVLDKCRESHERNECKKAIRKYNEGYEMYFTEFK